MIVLVLLAAFLLWAVFEEDGWRGLAVGAAVATGVLVAASQAQAAVHPARDTRAVAKSLVDRLAGREAPVAHAAFFNPKDGLFEYPGMRPSTWPQVQAAYTAAQRFWAERGQSPEGPAPTVYLASSLKDDDTSASDLQGPQGRTLSERLGSPTNRIYLLRPETRYLIDEMRSKDVHTRRQAAADLYTNVAHEYGHVVGLLDSDQYGLMDSSNPETPGDWRAAARSILGAAFYRHPNQMRQLPNGKWVRARS